MSLPATHRSRLFASLALVVLVGLLGLGLISWGERTSTGLERASYDSLHSLTPGNTDWLTNPPVVIVYLDLASYLRERQDPTQPWPRELQARLLERLTALGARAVVFDIIFSGAGPNAAADDLLARTLRASNRAILAGEHNEKQSHETSEDATWTRLKTTRPPYQPFTQAAAAWGVASLWIDDDFVVRRHLRAVGEEVVPTLSWAAAEWLQAPNRRQATLPGWIRYYGPAITLPHVSFGEALEPGAVPDSFFRDRVVFVGARPMERLFLGRQDEFASPFHSFRHKEYFVPGVEVHATALLNLMRGDGLHRLPFETEALVLLGAALLFGGGLIWLRPVPATVFALVGAGITLLAARWAFSAGLWFPWLVVAAVQIPAALFGSWLFQFWDWFRTRRRLEAARRIAEAKIREQAALLDKAQDAILVQDLQGRMVYANPSAERLYGWTLGELERAGAVEELFSPDAEAAGTARAAAQRVGEWNGELRQQTRAGRTVTMDSRWTLIRDDAGQPKALLIIGSDVTEKKELEAQFLRTQRMNTIGTLAGGMAHDLNNALAPILMGVQLLRRKGADEESSRMLGLIEVSTLRGADMVRQVLLFARGRGGELQFLKLALLVQELEKIVRETFPKSITVETYLPRDLWSVRGNPTQLHQVLLNLCVNARDAMPGGGRLSFAADNVTLTEAEVAALPEARPGDYVSLMVSDTGVGMPPEVKARIFEPFFTTKGEGRGTGIGLATVLRIVKSLGGFVRVDSEPGQGTTFEVYLPRTAEVPAGSESLVAAALPRGQGELILVADDEQAVRDLVAAGLSSFGYRVLTAANGEEALTHFKSQAQEIRLLITDHEMPAMDGPRLIAAIRQTPSDLPIVLVGSEMGSDQAGPAGVIGLRKPFSLEELLVAVQRALQSRSAHSSPPPNGTRSFSAWKAPNSA